MGSIPYFGANQNKPIMTTTQIPSGIYGSIENSKSEKVSEQNAAIFLPILAVFIIAAILHKMRKKVWGVL